MGYSDKLKQWHQEREERNKKRARKTYMPQKSRSQLFIFLLAIFIGYAGIQTYKKPPIPKTLLGHMHPTSTQEGKLLDSLREALKARQYHKALSYAEKLNNLDPQGSLPYLRGNLYQQMGKLDHAIKSYVASIEDAYEKEAAIQHIYDILQSLPPEKFASLYQSLPHALQQNPTFISLKNTLDPL